MNRQVAQGRMEGSQTVTQTVTDVGNHGGLSTMRVVASCPELTPTIVARSVSECLNAKIPTLRAGCERENRRRCMHEECAVC